MLLSMRGMGCVSGSYSIVDQDPGATID